MNRLWSRVSVRVTSVALLVLGIVGGVYLGQGRAVQQQVAEPKLVVQSEPDELTLLKQRQSQHAAARAWQRQQEGDAASKAAAKAKAAAAKAHKLEKTAIDKKVAEEKKKAAEAKAKAEAEEKEKSSSGGGSSGKEVPFSGDIPASCDEFSGNRAIGCAIMLDHGFKISQFGCLNSLWKRESNWTTKASNSSSGAYGIPQALPGSKMASAGSDWRTNPATQIKWGLGYIEGRYGSPCGAWDHSESHGWY